MKLSELIEQKEAHEYAKKAHEGQTRKSGGPYVRHPERVADIVRKYKKSHKLKELVSAAFLHDTIEDTNTTAEDLKKMFGALVASLVQELTSDKVKQKEIGKTKYLTQKMLNMSSWGLVIKLSDRLDNVSDLKTADEKFAKKYKKETESILKELKSKRKLSNTQKKLINAIEEKLSELNEETIEESLKNLFIKLLGVDIEKPEDEQPEEERIFISKIKKKIGERPTKEELLALKYQAVLDKFDPNYKHLILMVEKALKERIDPSLIMALVVKESSFKENARNYNRWNKTTDYGYFQLNDRWHKQHKSNVKKHIETGIEYLKWCLDTANGNEYRALARYNSGSETNRIGQNYARNVLSLKNEIDRKLKRVAQIRRKVEKFV